MRHISSAVCGRIAKGRVGSCFAGKRVQGARIVNSMQMICCPVSSSDALVKVGISRADGLRVCLRGHGVRHVIVDPGSGNILCPVSRVPTKGSHLRGFI